MKRESITILQPLPKPKAKGSCVPVTLLAAANNLQSAVDVLMLEINKSGSGSLWESCERLEAVSRYILRAVKHYEAANSATSQPSK